MQLDRIERITGVIVILLVGATLLCALSGVIPTLSQSGQGYWTQDPKPYPAPSFPTPCTGSCGAVRPLPPNG